MKTTMNFFKILTMALILCVSCSKNDDGDTPPVNNLEKSLIGTWKQMKFVVGCSSGSDEVSNSTACEQQGRLTIKSDGTFSETYYYDYGMGCEEEDIEMGSWRIYNNKLFVTDDYFGEYEVTYFEVTQNVLRVGQYDTDYPCDSGGNSTHYYYEYTRI